MHLLTGLLKSFNYVPNYATLWQLTIHDRVLHTTPEKMCKTKRCNFFRVYKTSSREVKRHGQSILHVHLFGRKNGKQTALSIMRKQTICICENKSSNQLRDCEADQRLFRYEDSAIPLFFQSLAIFCACTARFVMDLTKTTLLGFSFC